MKMQNEACDKIKIWNLLTSKELSLDHEEKLKFFYYYFKNEMTISDPGLNF